MKSLRKVSVTALLAGALLTGVSTIAMAETRPELGRVQVKYDSFTLPNGLTTLVCTDRSVPSVFVGVWYKVGSKDEPAGRTGFAHLFEHLMFQPTPNRPTEFFFPLEEVGATNMNGSTNTDFTNYYETVPSNALDRALWMEADRMKNLGDGITQALLDEQRAVVKNEKRQHELQPGADAYERYLQNYYPVGHPYAHTTIGSMEDLDKATLADVKAWFNANYGASNAVLVLSGDIDLETAKKKVADYFGDARPGQPLNALGQWVPSFSQIKRDIAYQNVANASLSRTWPLSNDAPRDNTLLQLAARTLAGSKNTPLNKLLVDDLQLATSVTAGVAENALSSAFSISIVLKPGVSPQVAGAALDKALESYFRQGPDKERLDAVISATDMALLRSMESSGAIGNWLIDGKVNHDDPLYFLKQRDWIVATTPAEVKTLAQATLQRPYYEMIQLPTPRAGTAPKSDIDPKVMPAPGPFKGKVAFPPTAETTLSNGMKLVVAERHNLPIVDASLQFETGSQAEDAYGRDTAERAFGLLTTGTRRYSAEALVRETGKLGMAIGGGAGGRQSSFTWSAQTGRLDQGFALAAEVIRRPTYPQAELDKRLATVESQFDDYERNPINSGGEIYKRAIWGAEHPYGHIDTRADYEHVTREAIQRFHDQEIAPNKATLFLMGDITLEQARRLAEKHFGDWKPLTTTPLKEPGPAMGAPGRVILVDAPGAQQSSIMVGHAVGPFDKDTAAAGSLMDEALGGGFDSRLNMNLREEKGWAYGFSSGVSNAPKGQRVFTASGTVQADHTADSMVEIRKEIADFVASRPITAAELEKNRASSMLAIPSGFSGNGAFLNSMISSAAYGLPYDRAAGAADRLAAVKLDDVRALATRTYRPDQLTWVVVGDLKQIETKVRALNFGPVEVWNVYGEHVR